jgi:hypothetical protein
MLGSLYLDWKTQMKPSVVTRYEEWLDSYSLVRQLLTTYNYTAGISFNINIKLFLENKLPDTS